MSTTLEQAGGTDPLFPELPTPSIASTRRDRAVARMADDQIDPVLRQPVSMIAIEPINQTLTLTARKVYMVMMHLTQKLVPDERGGYTCALMSVLHNLGETSRLTTRAQKYIEQMVSTMVLWRMYEPSPEERDLFDTLAGQAGHGDENTLPPAMARMGAKDSAKLSPWEQVRTFPLLSEARLTSYGGRIWVTWYYPPSLDQAIRKPEIWAQIEMASVVALSSYCALALYQICARFKDNPSGVTSRHEPQWWVSVLRDGSPTKDRAFRKFKNESLLPAIREINETTEIDVELIEHRLGGVLHQVQFKVSRKARPPKEPSSTFDKPLILPVDATLVEKAARLRIRESDLDDLVTRYGAAAVLQSMTEMEAFLARKPDAINGSRVAYLRGILKNMHDSPRAPAQQEIVQPVEVIKSEPTASELHIQHQERIKAWAAARHKVMIAELVSLSVEERQVFINMLLSSNASSVNQPIRKRLLSGEWQSPMVVGLVVRAYATSRYGPNWDKPSDLDLSMHDRKQQREEEQP